jgi:hypothetical protein
MFPVIEKMVRSFGRVVSDDSVKKGVAGALAAGVRRMCADRPRRRLWPPQVALHVRIATVSTT